MAELNNNDKQILSEILCDYMNFDKRSFTDDQIIAEILKKVTPAKKNRLVKTKTDLADELGITRKTFMTRIESNKDLYRELLDCGWSPDSRIFYPKEVEIIKKYLFY